MPDPAVVVEVVQRVEKVAAVSQPVPSAKPLIKEKPIATTTPAKTKATARNMKKVLAPAKASIAKKNPQPPPTSRLTPLSSTYVTNESNADERTSVKETVAPKILQPEQKGKAKYECGCFGRLHKPLANCLHCGRISCKKEGYDFCPFCEYMVHPVQPPVGERYVVVWDQGVGKLPRSSIVALRTAIALRSHRAYCLHLFFYYCSQLHRGLGPQRPVTSVRTRKHSKNRRLGRPG